MARYRKIHIAMYADASFNAVSKPQPNAQTLWVYLLTGPHTTAIPGLSCIGEAALAEALGWPLEAFREAFLELSERGMVRADWKARVVWIPNAPKYNPPESPNVITGWAKAWDEIPECALKTLALDMLCAFAEDLPKAFQEAFAKGFGKGLRQRSARPSANQEQEQEQEQEEYNSLSTDCSAEPQAAAAADTPLAADDSSTPAFLEFPVNHRRAEPASWPLREGHLAELAETFGGLDVRAEARKALGWLNANPGRRKTARGMKRFLFGWMERAQHRGGSSNSGGSRGSRGSAVSPDAGEDTLIFQAPTAEQLALLEPPERSDAP